MGGTRVRAIAAPRRRAVAAPPCSVPALLLLGALWRTDSATVAGLAAPAAEAVRIRIDGGVVVVVGET